MQSIKNKITLLLLTLVISSVANALDFGITVMNEKHAEIEAGDSNTLWYSSSVGADVFDSLEKYSGVSEDDMLQVVSDIASGVGSETGTANFIGHGNEIKFTKRIITVETNTPCDVYAIVEPFEDSTTQTPFNGIASFVALADGSTNSVIFWPGDVDTTSGLGLTPVSIYNNSCVTYDVITGVKIPEEFYNVSAGTYSSTIVFTVVAK